MVEDVSQQIKLQHPVFKADIPELSRIFPVSDLSMLSYILIF